MTGETFDRMPDGDVTVALPSDDPTGTASDGRNGITSTTPVTRPGTGYLVTLAVVVVGVAVTSATGLRAPFWYDEAITATTVSRGIGGTVGILGHADGGFAGYTFLLSPWSSAGAESELWLRLPSLLAVLATIVLTAELGRRIAGGACGLVAALLVAVGGGIVAEYANEARPYAVVTALVTLVALLTHRASRRGFTVGSVALLAVLIAAATSVHTLSLVAVVMFTPWLIRAAQVST
ncbi:hypothetical protein [Gordonia sp. NPDC003950]